MLESMQKAKQIYIAQDSGTTLTLISWELRYTSEGKILTVL